MAAQTSKSIIKAKYMTLTDIARKMIAYDNTPYLNLWRFICTRVSVLNRRTARGTWFALH